MTRYGGFWRRVAAYAIDALIVLIPLSIVYHVLGVAHGSGVTTSQNPDGSGAGVHVGLWVEHPADVVTLIVAWLYEALQESSARQATLGKRAMGMIVTGLDGARIGFGRATGRHFAKYLSAIILGIGFIMVAFMPRKQGLHDLIASTLVPRQQTPTPYDLPLPPP